MSTAARLLHRRALPVNNLKFASTARWSQYGLPRSHRIGLSRSQHQRPLLTVQQRWLSAATSEASITEEETTTDKTDIPKRNRNRNRSKRQKNKGLANLQIKPPKQHAPETRFESGTIANLAAASVVGSAGQTVVLSTVTTDSKNVDSGTSTNSLGEALKAHAAELSSMAPLTVDYRERYAGVGQIPTNNASRRDNARPTDQEVLGSRAIDRALRPLLSNKQQDVHVTCSVESCGLFQSDGGHAVSLALNSASAALLKAGLLKEPVASVCLSVMEDGTVIQDPSPRQIKDGCMELLYAGTSSSTVMLEFSAKQPQQDDAESNSKPEIPEDILVQLLQEASKAIQPLLQSQQEFLDSCKVENDVPSDDELRASLGLPLHDEEANTTNKKADLEELKTQLKQIEDKLSAENNGVPINAASHKQVSQALFDGDPNQPTSKNVLEALKEEGSTMADLVLQLRQCSRDMKLLETTGPEEKSNDSVVASDAENILEQALSFCRKKLDDAPLRLFGYNGGTAVGATAKAGEATIHPSFVPLLSKSVRGRREHLVLQEIEQLIREEFVPEDVHFQAEFRELREQNDEALSLLAHAIHEKVLKAALFETATLHGTRGDGRGSGNKGVTTVRPLSVRVPALPNVVHGSSLFSRGETQVLCTATLGAPRDGLPITNPYMATTDPQSMSKAATQPKGPYDDLPVGSLRYLRSQTALISDLNTRNVKAEQERTGESGTLDEVQRAFLQYDFPSFSTGEVPTGKGVSANRRAIGHGALAEKAILPMLPPPSDFPYAIRLTSQVMGSNGSSSMATVCGATLALLDAGVPISAPVAGVSVGLTTAKDDESTRNSELDSDPLYGLLLDITGTEDHYGGMDFKTAGTGDGVTALQLDVKQPLPMHVLVEALELAKKGRKAILDEMSVLSQKSSDGIVFDLKPRSNLKDTAPRVEVVRFDPLRKRDLIGPGGAVLRQLEDRFGVSLDLSQEGQCLLYGANRHMVAKARSAVMDLVADIEVGEIYEGTIIEIKDFGAVVELLRNKEGLLHVSELVDNVESKSKLQGNYGVVKDHLRVGQKIEVLCTAVDPVQGSIRLSRKKLQHKKGYSSN